MDGTKHIKILIVDDHPIVRDGLQGQLASQPDFQVVGEAASAEEALAVLGQREVDILLTDLRMPGLGGLELIRRVDRNFPAVEIVVLTTYDTDDDVRPALDLGARSYLLKEAHREELFSTVRAAHRGTPTYSPSVERQLRQDQPRPVLSNREQEILQLVASGRTNQQIATELFIGHATVKTHLAHIFAKLEVTDRAAAVAVGYHQKLL